MNRSLIDEIYRVEPGLRVWRICHSGFILKVLDVVIVIDPAIEIVDNDPTLSEHSGHLRLKKKLPLLARDLGNVDLVLVSHADEDHSGSKSIALLEPKTQVFVAPPETASKLRGIGVPPARIRRAYWREPLFYGEIRIVPTEAHHHLPHGCGCGFYIETPAGSVWYPGDSILLPAHFEVTPPDLFLLPISKHLLGPVKGGQLADHLQVEHIIPCHYGTYEGGGAWTVGDIDALKQNVQNPGRRIQVLELGEMFHLQ